MLELYVVLQFNIWLVHCGRVKADPFSGLTGLVHILFLVNQDSDQLIK